MDGHTGVLTRSSSGAWSTETVLTTRTVPTITVSTAIDGTGNAIAVFGSSYTWDLAGGSWKTPASLPSGSSGGLAIADQGGTFVYADTTGNAFTFTAGATSFGTGSGSHASLGDLKSSRPSRHAGHQRGISRARELTTRLRRTSCERQWAPSRRPEHCWPALAAHRSPARRWPSPRPSPCCARQAATAARSSTASACCPPTAGQPYEAFLLTSNGAVDTFTITSGSLPPGLSMPATYGAAGTIVGGTRTKPGTYTVTVHVTPFGATTPSTNGTYSITVGPPPPLTITFPATCCNAGTVGSSYLQNFFSSGGTGPFTWTVAAGQLPPGVTLTGNHLSGTPTTAGTSRFTIKVTDSAGNHATESGSITIGPVPPGSRREAAGLSRRRADRP